MKSHYWIIVADGSRARVLQADSPSAALQEVTDMVHPQARLHERELRTDAPGKVYDSAGHASHSTIDKEPVKAHEFEVFAREIADFVREGWQAQRFQHLILIAEPQFLGRLRQVLDPELKERICLELPKDYTRLQAQEIRAHLPERLPLQAQP